MLHAELKSQIPTTIIVAKNISVRVFWVENLFSSHFHLETPLKHPKKTSSNHIIILKHLKNKNQQNKKSLN